MDDKELLSIMQSLVNCEHMGDVESVVESLLKERPHLLDAVLEGANEGQWGWLRSRVKTAQPTPPTPE